MMRPLHWLLAAVLAIVLHGGLLALAASSPQADVERSAGRPGAVWGLPVETISDTITPSAPDSSATHAEPVEDATEIEPVETVAVEQPADAEPVNPAPAEPVNSPPVAESIRETAEPTLEAVAPADESPHAEDTPPAVAARTGGIAVAVPAEEASDVETLEIETAAPLEVAALEPAANEVAAEDITMPLPPVRPADVPRTTTKPVSKPAPAKPTTAAASAARPTAAKSAARSTGSGTPGAAPAGEQVGSGGTRQADGGKALVSSFAGRVAAHLQRHKRYPGDAADKRLSGTATVTFTIGSDGRVRGAKLARSSGQGVFDREVVAMVGRAEPFPQIPPAIGRSAMTFTVPVRFKPN